MLDSKGSVLLTRVISPKTCENTPYFSQILFYLFLLLFVSEWLESNVCMAEWKCGELEVFN